MMSVFSTIARWGAPLAALLLATRGDDTPQQAAPCRARGAQVLVYEGSRLFESSASQLALARGRVSSCAGPRASGVIAALERALESFPSERLGAPVRVHVDPRLPSHERPVTGIEVHATSREILAEGAALARLPAAAWKHELLHTLAPPPPFTSPVPRRLWLTLEEGLVTYLARAFEPRPHASAGTSEWGALPGAWEELALPEYDPHALARELALELSRSAPEPSAAQQGLLDCLMTDPVPAARETLREVSGTFVSRCERDAAALLAAAAGRWLPEPLSPWPQPGAPVLAARETETR